MILPMTGLAREQPRAQAASWVGSGRSGAMDVDSSEVLADVR